MKKSFLSLFASTLALAKAMAFTAFAVLKLRWQFRHNPNIKISVPHLGEVQIVRNGGFRSACWRIDHHFFSSSRLNAATSAFNRFSGSTPGFRG